MFLGCRLAKGLDLKRIMDYFTWVWRFSNKFIYDYLKGKTRNSENNTRRSRNVEQFTRSVRSIQSSMTDTYKNRNLNQKN